MTAREFYSLIYAIIGDATPLLGDCGISCDAACCKGDDDTGMYLFPREEALYGDLDEGCHIYGTDFEYGTKTTLLYTCPGVCNRNHRPLSCRIFPLMPYKTGSGVDIRIDPRARAMCPLFDLEIGDFNKNFVRRVRRAMNLMNKWREGREFIAALSRLTDEFTL